jgi:hypothetical protein
MAVIRFENPNVICLVAISSEEDLQCQKMSINPPPADGKCDCCDKHINDLEPFSISNYSDVGDIDGALLVKRFRTMAPPNEEVDRIMKEFFGSCLSDEDEKKAEERLIEVYGKEKAKDLLYHFRNDMQQNIADNPSRSNQLRGDYHGSTESGD